MNVYYMNYVFNKSKGIFMSWGFYDSINFSDDSNETITLLLLSDFIIIFFFITLRRAHLS
jgi:hypothetical protein